MHWVRPLPRLADRQSFEQRLAMACRVEKGYDEAMPRAEEKTWEMNAPSHIALNSIVAALSGALIVLIVQGPEATKWEFLSLVLLTGSFFFFAISAEQTVNALDERDVKKYVYYMLLYNLGVILLGVAIELLAYAHFNPWVLARLPSWFSPVVAWVWLVLPAFFLWTWIKDSKALLCASKEDFDAWLRELEDEQKAVPEHSVFMRTFYNIRKRLHG